MATIKDVAELAGVGLGTASRVINHRGAVSESTKKRVLDAIEALGYVPDARARAMITKRSYTLGVVLPDLTNPFFPGLARGIEQKARQHGYTIVVLDTDWLEATEHTAIETLIKQGVDGAILISSSNAQLSSYKLREAKVPLVLLDRGIDDLGVSQVTVDHYRGALKAVEWAHAQGHTHIGFISGARHISSADLRLRGYLDGMGLEHIALDDLTQHPELPIAYGDFSFEKGQAQAPLLLARHPELTCIFAANDLSALGVLNYLTSHEIKVPDQIAVIGFDDILMASLYHPSLTTIQQPTLKMGELAAELLIESIEFPEKREPKHYALDPDLIVRQSC